MPRTAGSLVTDADLNGIYPPKSGYTPTGDASKILSGAEINARYTVNGAPNDNRCPSWDQLSTAATTATTTYSMSLMGASGSTSYFTAVINGVTHINTTAGLSGTKELPLNQGSCYVTLVKHNLVAYCSIGVYDITGGGEILLWYYETAGTRYFDLVAGRKYDIRGYAGSGIPLKPQKK